MEQGSDGCAGQSFSLICRKRHPPPLGEEQGSTENQKQHADGRVPIRVLFHWGARIKRG